MPSLDSFRNDMVWWRSARDPWPVGNVLYQNDEFSVRRPRLEEFKDIFLPLPGDGERAIITGASGTVG